MCVDVLAFSPHPDDADMGCGGLLLKLKSLGYTTGIIDVTEAELSSNGDPDTRKKETLNASKILKLDIRENLKIDSQFHKPKIVISYMLNYQFKPSFIVDISDYYIQKMKAFAAYKSQFGREGGGQSTYINSRYFYDFITSRNKYYGLKINVEYGEPFYIESDIKIDNPLKFFDYII